MGGDSASPHLFQMFQSRRRILSRGLRLDNPHLSAAAAGNPARRIAPPPARPRPTPGQLRCYGDQWAARSTGGPGCSLGIQHGGGSGRCGGGAGPLKAVREPEFRAEQPGRERPRRQAGRLGGLPCGRPVVGVGGPGTRCGGGGEQPWGGGAGGVKVHSGGKGRAEEGRGSKPRVGEGAVATRG